MNPTPNINRYIEEYKAKLKLADWIVKHTLRTTESEPELEDCDAFIIPDDNKKQAVICFDSDAIKKYSDAKLTQLIVHELAHVFTLPLIDIFDHLIEPMYKMVGEKISDKIRKAIDKAEHRVIKHILKMI